MAINVSALRALSRLDLDAKRLIFVPLESDSSQPSPEGITLHNLGFQPQDTSDHTHRAPEAAQEP